MFKTTSLIQKQYHKQIWIGTLQSIDCLCSSLFVVFSFYNSEVYEQKLSIERVRNQSQNAGNGHFRDSIFK